MELRVIYGAPREPDADPDDVHRLRKRYRARPSRVLRALPPPPSDAERAAIREHVSAIEDLELRGIVELLRSSWNCKTHWFAIMLSTFALRASG